jgi:hypothetical protein
VSDLNFLLPAVVHYFFEIIVIEEKLEVSVRIGVCNAINMVNWRGVVPFGVNCYSAILF